MKQRVLHLSREDFSAIRTHLLSGHTQEEQAVFAYAITNKDSDKSLDLRIIEIDFITPEDFLHQSEMNIELKDTKRAQIIKRAHELSASIVEWHSHPMFWPAMFSVSDMTGLQEFVSHVMWRLKGRPYVAIVVTPYDFDALIWIDPIKASHLNYLKIGSRKLYPTGKTLKGK